MINQILLTPFFLDQPSPGLAGLAEAGWHQNSPRLSGGEQLARMASVHQGLSDLVAEAAARSDRPVSLAGDCCAAIPVLGGLQRAGIDPLLL